MLVMMLCGRFIFSTLLATSCFAGITIKTSQLYKPGPAETVVDLLTSCYENRITTLGLAGNSTEVISKILWSRGSPGLTLINATSRSVNNSPSDSKKPFKLQVFVVTTSSPIDLTTSLRKIKASIFWNHMATFLILEWPSSGCSNPFEMLWKAWEMNILDAKLICHNPEKGLLIYTFNPYKSSAPVTWQLVKVYNGNDGHPWTLFARPHEINLKKICSELDFEKTNDLDGYKISVSVTDLTVDREIDKTPKVCVGHYEQIICDIIFPALNAKPNVLNHSIESVGYVDKHGNPGGILKEVMNGQSDVGLLGRYVTSLTNLPISYPHWQSSLKIMTQYRGYKSQLGKIASVVDIKSRFCLGLVCLINIVMFRFFLHQPIMVACLNTFRMICYVCFLKEPGKVAPRIYLVSLLLFGVTMHGIYEGKLASLLTKQEPRGNVHTKKDLVALDYTVYGSTTYRIHFREEEFQGRFVELKEILCTKYVLKNSRAACVADGDFLLNDASKFKLHLSGSLVNTHMALPIRPDWPLENRVNSILRRSVEHYWGTLLLEKILGKANHALLIREYKLKNQGFRVLTLRQLRFVFVILGIGLGFATISFVIEVLIRSSCPKYTKIRKVVRVLWN